MICLFIVNTNAIGLYNNDKYGLLEDQIDRLFANIQIKIQQTISIHNILYNYMLK